MKTALLILACATLAGCYDKPGPEKTQVPPFFAPSASVARSQARPDYLLPGSDADQYIPRFDRFAYASNTSSATIYTYDSEAIHIRNSGGSGYRYRWIVEQLGQ